MKAAIITPAIADPNRLYGAERHYVGMVQAFQKKVETEWIQIAATEYNWEAVLQGYLDCYQLDVSRFDVVVSTKNPTYMVQHPHHVCWLLHQLRVFYDRFEDEYGSLPAIALAEKRRQRDVITRLDNLAFRQVRRIFTNGNETARRLKFYNGFHAEVLHPPVYASGQYCGAQEYFLLPGRLHRWKRVDLALRAMQHMKADIPLLIAGAGEDETEFREMAAGDPRIRFLGFVQDAELLDLYANALGVLFVPKQEDFGYITVEAMLSHKPVIVCNDSGEPASLIRDGESGLVVDPDPKEIAHAMNLLIADKARAREMGEAAWRSAPGQSWEPIVDRLLEAAYQEPVVAEAVEPEQTSALPPLLQTPVDPARVLITDNQVLEPAVGGARVRVKEICKELSQHFPTEYIGAYDWPGPTGTDEWPLPNWHCRVLALSAQHYKTAARLQKLVPGGSVIDVSFPWMTRLSPDFVKALHQTVRESDVVVFTHPWVYPLAKHLLKDKLVIYDAHNFEYGLRSRLLASSAVGRLLAAGVKRVEGELARRADDVWVCSWDDADAMAQAYSVPRKRFHLVPNCADTKALRPATEGERAAAKAARGWQGHEVAIFVGSGYGPNTEAVAFIIERLAPAFPDVIFAIAGSVKEDYLRTHSADLPANVQLLGVIIEDELYSLFAAVDFGLNPVEVGSGTNLKLVQYMAAGLAIISTETGVRGIENASQMCVVANRSDFAASLKMLRDDPTMRERLSKLARREAEQHYDWSTVVRRTAYRINSLLRYRRRMEPPFFTVVIPTFNRRDHLLRLFDALARQTFRDFEVVAVDQSEPPVEIPDNYRLKLALRMVYSEARGPALARNKGIKEARGHVIAFTDDDCIPEPDWLENAARHFDERPLAGLEGLICSDKLGDPKFRTVSNVGAEGLGFMTANMFYRRDLLLRLDGFDERFHDFREDTDLAWRVMDFGDIPHARDSVVFHPPHPVTVERESQSERAKMFRLDPLLLERHPDKYLELLIRERHYRYKPGFWQHFARGLRECGVHAPVTRLFQQLRLHDPEWWLLVTTAKTRHSDSAMTPEDVAAVQSLIAEYMVAPAREQELNA
jgi:glycosyltransferase involved in cell wall biosynthesis/GT2 family glycosyltransferase